MIKAKSALLALVAVLVICLLVGCVVDGGENNNNGPSVGLAYTSNSDGSCYVSGIGSCTDKQIKIPATSPDGDTVIGSLPSTSPSLGALVVADTENT